MRTIMIAGAIASCALAMAAVAAPAVDLQADSISPATRGFAARAPTFGDRNALIRQWAGVGRCVVSRDRNASVAFVRAPLGSDDASDAARRLDPVFASCLAGSRVPGPSSVVLRRAAVARALGGLGLAI